MRLGSRIESKLLNSASTSNVKFKSAFCGVFKRSLVRTCIRSLIRLGSRNETRQNQEPCEAWVKN